MIGKQEAYSTRNLNLAAFLFASGLQFTGADKIKKEYFFNFIPADKATKLVENYYHGTATINPRELFARLNDLRDIVFSTI
jgi:hypothetical protein